jgi:RHS repeat-associated protein
MSSKSVDGLVTSYGYDNADQLVLESRSGYSATYSYDGNGNRLAKVLNGVTEAYTYDDGDKMLTAGTKSYAYDLAGRTQSVTSPGGTTTCAYDDEDRLTSLVGPGVNQQYTYNGLDARRSKISGGVTVNTYKRQGVSPTAPVVSDGQATYTPGISERRSGASKFFHSDYLGSNKTLTNSSQAVTDTRSFDAFGLQTGSTGSSPTPFGFAGGWGYQQDSTGLQLLGHRYYDPSTGRFLTRDPIGDGRNWYGYCGNNPIRSVDPTGLSIQTVKKGSQRYERIQAGINGLRAKGQTAAADHLQDMLDHGRIKVADNGELGDAAAETDIANDTMTIDSTVIGAIDVAGTAQPERAAYWKRRAKLNLESVLFHEWVHTTQDGFLHLRLYRSSLAELEAEAYERQFEYEWSMYLQCKDAGDKEGADIHSQLALKYLKIGIDVVLHGRKKR